MEVGVWYPVINFRHILGRTIYLMHSASENGMYVRHCLYSVYFDFSIFQHPGRVDSQTVLVFMVRLDIVVHQASLVEQVLVTNGTNVKPRISLRDTEGKDSNVGIQARVTVGPVKKRPKVRGAQVGKGQADDAERKIRFNNFDLAEFGDHSPIKWHGIKSWRSAVNTTHDIARCGEIADFQAPGIESLALGLRSKEAGYALLGYEVPFDGGILPSGKAWYYPLAFFPLFFPLYDILPPFKNVFALFAGKPCVG